MNFCSGWSYNSNNPSNLHSWNFLSKLIRKFLAGISDAEGLFSTVDCPSNCVDGNLIGKNN